jgi:hypothetical protein
MAKQVGYDKAIPKEFKRRATRQALEDQRRLRIMKLGGYVIERNQFQENQGLLFRASRCLWRLDGLVQNGKDGYLAKPRRIETNLSGY